MSELSDRLNAALADRYAIERELGAGGMATVYLALDLKHERQVAVKVLRPELAAVLGAERFLQEIKTTANLQHPHILPLFDSGEAEGFLYYVMPYVEGESLREKLNREKQLGIEESLEITKAVAQALDYAHRHEVIHRDIKPENILLHDGQPVVADFGIALAVSAAGGTRLTETGLSLGTPQYMSPEQATGDRELDGRSDIYSLACVLYEMLSGEPPHTGPTVQAVIAKVVTDRPRPITELRDTVPTNVSAAIKKALAKLPADRFTAASQFSHALAAHGAPVPVLGPSDVSESSTLTPGSAVVSRRFLWLAGVAILVLTTVAIWGWARPGGDPTGPRGLARLVIPQPPDHQFVVRNDGAVPLAISPDGKALVYVGARDSTRQLYLRRLAEFDAVPMPGTEGARLPFFSPDGEWVGFATADALYRVPATGAPPQKITDVDLDLRGGASWGTRDTIVFAGVGIGLFQVAAAGGVPEQLTEIDRDRGEITHSQPHFLPDGTGVLYTTLLAGEHFQTALLSLPERESVLLPSDADGVGPKYLSTGHLLVSRYGELVAIPFDAERGELRGSPITVLDSLYMNILKMGVFDVSRSGTLVYLPGVPESKIVWVDRRGGVIGTQLPAAIYRRPRLSPEGTQIAVEKTEWPSKQIWIYDSQQRQRQFTTSGQNNSTAVWSPDAEQIAFCSNRRRAGEMFIKQSDGTGDARLLLSVGNTTTCPTSWSRDGVLALEANPTGGEDIWVLRNSVDSTPVEFLTAPEKEQAAMLSPDGRWLAYTVEDGDGDNEVFVTAYPGPGSQIPISVGGGRAPMWSRNGSELFYRGNVDDRMYAVSLQVGATLIAEPPRLLFVGNFERNPGPLANYDVAGDGRFLMLQKDEMPVEFRVVIGWLDELSERVRN